ncbi:hypothetical protein BURKHO8Y_70152 [Burkholderia sp. 8Y]|nr:hypothetical protein BURKHO8Y_70152 [Burkholderia sp. 8Y]
MAVTRQEFVCLFVSEAVRKLQALANA